MPDSFTQRQIGNGNVSQPPIYLYDYTLNGVPFYGKPDEVIGGLAICIDARGVRRPLRPEPHMVKLIPETDRK